MRKNELFTFAISLSVLDHLGRNLYRSFATVLGEAISNSWDADAKNVWIYLDKDNNCLIIKDDGDGMTYDDFQNKFLKIGYSKRRKGKDASNEGRPFIGRKGIGKLALLSCAKKISVLSKTKNSSYIGGVVDNTGLDDAITEDVAASEYHLGNVNMEDFNKHTWKHEKGTIIYFEDIKEGVKSSIEFLRKIVALYFRFSLVDPSFKIFFDNQEITLKDLQDLTKNTEFLWTINGFGDPYISMIENLKEKNNIPTPANSSILIWGFVASVKKPKDLKIFGSGEKIGIDLFVNGRLREKDIQKYVPTARIVEDYLYGQIHFNGLDDKERDRFSTSREGIVADDEKFKEFLKIFRGEIISKILDKWDEWRLAHKEDGDPDNPKMPKNERRAKELYEETSKDFEPEEGGDPDKRKKIDGWIGDLGDDARHNFTSYAECFISENLVRKHIQEKSILLSPEASTEIALRKSNEVLNKNKGNISIDIRKTSADTSYLSMDHLANLVDKRDPVRESCLSRDANEYKPIRDALMHTALLTDDAKTKLKTVKQNIKGRVKNLLSGN